MQVIYLSNLKGVSFENTNPIQTIKKLQAVKAKKQNANLVKSLIPPCTKLFM